MKHTVNFNQFYDEFNKHLPDNYSYYGLKALFEYFEQYEQDCDMEIEMDVIAICCEYTEYESIAEFQGNYSDEYQTLEDIEEHTQVIRVGKNGFIIQNF